MTQDSYADLSSLLFGTALVLYVLAMASDLYHLAFTRVAAEVAPSGPSRLARAAAPVGTTLAAIGLVAHLGHLITRSLAAGGRVPWGNMFEYSSLMGFGIVAAGLIIFQWRMKRPELMAFLLFGGILAMAAALLVWSEPGPLMPILESQWLKIHVFAIAFAATTFAVGAVFTGLYLLRDTAETRLAALTTAGLAGSTVGAAYVGETVVEGDGTAVDEHGLPVDLMSGGVSATSMGDDDIAYGAALRATISPKRLALWTLVAPTLVTWVFVPAADTVGEGIGRFLGMNLFIMFGALMAWRFLPSLPSAATLDSLAYRTNAFAFPIWTFAVLAGAVWAEQSWGRYWGWDPKETSAFLTWVAYASYLHARATRGMRGRNAAWLGMGAFGVLLFTYFAVNLVFVGLHSYAGTS